MKKVKLLFSVYQVGVAGDIIEVSDENYPYIARYSELIGDVKYEKLAEDPSVFDNTKEDKRLKSKKTITK